jgi:hypothetical protein
MPSHPLQFVLVALAGWLNQQQRDVIDFLHEDNRVAVSQRRGKVVRTSMNPRGGHKSSERSYSIA